MLSYIDNPKKCIYPNDIGSIRVMTYNVHGFKDKNFNNTFESIITNIKSISPTFIILQELYINDNDKIDYKSLISELKKCGLAHYIFSTNKINGIFSKYKIHSKQINLEKDSINNIGRNALICSFPKFNDIIFIGTHLDVFDNTGKTRKKQITQIFDVINRDEYKNKKIVIAGDLNSLRKKDYNEIEWKHIVDTDNKRNVKTIEDVIPIIENNGFNESFNDNNSRLNVSVWSERRVDYIFGRNIKFIDSYVYESTASDHYPIYADIL